MSKNMSNNSNNINNTSKLEFKEMVLNFGEAVKLKRSRAGGTGGKMQYDLSTLIKSYLSIEVLISQDGTTANPTILVKRNDFVGYNFSIVREATGVYTYGLTKESAASNVPVDDILTSTGNIGIILGLCEHIAGGGNDAYLLPTAALGRSAGSTYPNKILVTDSSGTPIDGALINTLFEIRLYA